MPRSGNLGLINCNWSLRSGPIYFNPDKEPPLTKQLFVRQIDSDSTSSSTSQSSTTIPTPQNTRVGIRYEVEDGKVVKRPILPEIEEVFPGKHELSITKEQDEGYQRLTSGWKREYAEWERDSKVESALAKLIRETVDVRFHNFLYPAQAPNTTYMGRMSESRSSP
jgi:hypothetical protein